MNHARFAFALLTMLALGACEPVGLLQNPLVDRWCGERPCGWEVDGQVERVGTWHANDYAASLVTDRTRLSQYNDEVDERTDCFEFSMIAKVDDRARVFVELDFMDDGSAEFSARLRPTDYQPLHFLISTPTWYRGVRFIVRKDGPGEAVVAKLRATESSKCTAAPLQMPNRPLSAWCDDDDECESELCEDGRCAACRREKDCADDESCGYVIAEYGETRGCVERGSAPLGAACSAHGQCESDVCCGGICSECCATGSCPAGVACTLSLSVRDVDLLSAPRLCGAGDGARAQGAACVDDDDCASGSCTGSDAVCAVETCAPNDDSCWPLCLVGRVTPGTCD